MNAEKAILDRSARCGSGGGMATGASPSALRPVGVRLQEGDEPFWVRFSLPVPEALAGQATWIDRSFTESGGGTVVVPEVLRPYMGGTHKIG